MICKNPGGGTPPPNFPQGGGNGLPPPPPLETAYGLNHKSLEPNVVNILYFKL